MKNKLALMISIGTLGLVFVLCVTMGSVRVPLSEALSILLSLTPAGEAGISEQFAVIIKQIRIPRVLGAAGAGALLSVCGTAMQGLVKNPLAEASTLGISAGAALGAVLALAFAPAALAFGGTLALSMLTAFLSLLLILALAYKVDATLSSNTLILTGIIFSMFVNSFLGLLIAFSGERLKNIIFWTMGSLTGFSIREAMILVLAALIGGTLLWQKAGALNAFAVGEETALYVGVNVKPTKLFMLIVVSIMVGLCVSLCGTIGFVGLMVPHICRILVGVDNKVLLPMSMVVGANFLMLADLASRTILAPVELPIGIPTSLFGAVMFLYIFLKNKKPV